MTRFRKTEFFSGDPWFGQSAAADVGSAYGVGADTKAIAPPPVRASVRVSCSACFSPMVFIEGPGGPVPLLDSLPGGKENDAKIVIFGTCWPLCVFPSGYYTLAKARFVSALKKNTKKWRTTLARRRSARFVAIFSGFEDVSKYA